MVWLLEALPAAPEITGASASLMLVSVYAKRNSAVS